MEHIILASGSPQRKTLLEGIGVQFTVVHSNIDEDGHPEKEPTERALILSELKALEVAKMHPDRWVLGADTLVVSANGMLLEKPKDEKEARAMLMEQSGSVSVVHSALCLRAPDGSLFKDINSSRVHFAPLTDTDIDWWIDTKLWQGRSGGFQIDGPGQLMIERIEGDWTGIVGLPIFTFGQVAERAGLKLL
ncbi:MAG TPA: nucleoside triphosphate pyrophosphatase [Candidatus Peribacteraceae bacterium]|nr:nucleoside triphosphate pyrophosphatase [Candidatus Peribacteraceae bacterium]